MEDVMLLRLLHKDPNAGMEQLMNQYAGLVYAVVKGRLASSVCVSSDWEDCVADVFGAFYTELHKFDPSRSSIKSYLCVLARNRATDVFRKRIKQGVDTWSECQTTEADRLTQQLRRDVLCAVKDLGEPDTSIVIRKYYLGESSAEIAAALNLTVSNVDTRTHRALNKLRQLFGGEEA